MEMTVSKERFLKIARIVEESESEEILFSFIVGSLFPNAWDNIQACLRDEHTKGYIEGREAARSDY